MFANGKPIQRTKTSWEVLAETKLTKIYNIWTRKERKHTRYAFNQRVQVLKLTDKVNVSNGQLASGGQENKQRFNGNLLVVIESA